MDKQVLDLVEKWKEKCINPKYGDEKIAEIAINCISLANTWLNNHKPTENESLKVKLLDSSHEIIDTLRGITSGNLPFTILETITMKSNIVSYLTLNSYIYTIGRGEVELETLGELEIS